MGSKTLAPVVGGDDDCGCALAEDEEDKAGRCLRGPVKGRDGGLEGGE